MEKKIYIIIPVFNRLKFTVECINSLLSQHYNNYKIIVVNHGSTDNTAAYITEHYPLVFLLNAGSDLWWTGATNMGVEKALALSKSDYDFILTLNNDLIVNEDYLTNLLALAKQHPKALIGSLSLNINQPDKIHFAGTKWNSKTAKYNSALHKKISYKNLKKQRDFIETDLLPGRGILIPFKAFREVGLYDVKYFPHYMADEDFSLRAKKAGYELLISVHAAVYNHVQETGLKNRRRNWSYYKDVFTSVKSPANTTNRWNWAKRHATVFPPVYFAIDMLRILKSLVIK